MIRLLNQVILHFSIGVQAHIGHHIEICYQFPFLFPNSCYKKKIYRIVPKNRTVRSQN